MFILVTDAVYEDDREVLLSKDNIDVLGPRSLDGLTMSALSMIIVASALCSTDKGCPKSKALLKIFRIGGFSKIFYRLGLTGLVELFLTSIIVTKMNFESGPSLLTINLILLDARF